MENITDVINEKLYSMLVFFFYVLLIIILFRVIIVLAISPNKKEDKKRKHNLSEKSNFNYIGTDKLYPDDPDFVENESWREELISFYLQDKKNRIKRSDSLYEGEDKLYPGDLLYFGKKTKKKITRKKETVLNLIKDNNQLTKTKRNKNKLKGNTKKTKEDNLRIFKDNFLGKTN